MEWKKTYTYTEIVEMIQYNIYNGRDIVWPKNIVCLDSFDSNFKYFQIEGTDCDIPIYSYYDVIEDNITKERYMVLSMKYFNKDCISYAIKGIGSSTPFVSQSFRSTFSSEEEKYTLVAHYDFTKNEFVFLKECSVEEKKDIYRLVV